MRCLFCGKELALLKRLRGGDDFCSEAHRKQYQEQYEQLALARLLQAKPSGEPAIPLPRRGAPSNAPDLAAAEVPDLERPQQQRPSVAIIEAPFEEASPALAGFVFEELVPAMTPFQYAGLVELVTSPPSMPAWTNENSAESASSGPRGSLPPAPRVALHLSLKALDHQTRKGERGLELREFTAPAPVMEMRLRPDAGTEPASAADVMEILMSPHPPQKAKSWLGVPRGFPAAPAELGDLARLDFSSTGFAYADGPVAAPAQTTPAPQATVPIPELPQAAPARKAFVAPAPAAPPPPAEPAPPAPVTKVLPVTLHGLAAARGKFAHTFTSSIRGASDVQIPPSAALPLRPVIVFGPAPAPAPIPDAAASPVQPRRVQQRAAAPPPPVQPRPIPPSVVPSPKAVPVKRSAAPEIPVQERVLAPAAPAVTPRVQPRAEPVAERPNVQARSRWPAPSASETAVPSMRFEVTESAWSRLSTGLKIGVAAALIVGLTGIGYLITRGNGKTTSPAPAAATPASPAVATGVAISGGWIDDWANFGKSRRRISLLSGSAKLSDYRLEFQAQIQTKAIGWIFRGLNPRNYYVAKLETITPGLEPTIALVHFAVVDGQDENRKAVPLPLKLRVDTVYKIRFDAIGNRFTTWVQGQKIDEWTDTRFGSGGVGFLSEGSERAALQGTVNVVPLVPKN